MFELSESQRRERARQHIESAEAWLRNLIHHQLEDAFGGDYFCQKLPTGESVIKEKIRTEIKQRYDSAQGHSKKAFHSMSDCADAVLGEDFAGFARGLGEAVQ